MTPLQSISEDEWSQWLAKCSLIDLQAFLHTIEREPISSKLTFLPYLAEEYPALSKLWSSLASLSDKLKDLSLNLT